MQEVEDEFTEEDIVHKFLFVGKNIDEKMIKEKIEETLVNNR